MSWSMSGKPRVEAITKKLATYFSEMEPAPNDRPIRERRVAYLEKQIADGKFRTCEWACATCKETGKLYRVNGKHTSTLLTQMNGEFPKGLSVIVERYECDTLEDVASLYSTFDTKMASRSQGDVNRIFAGAHDELRDIPAHIIGRCVTGMSYVVFGVNASISGWQTGATQEEKAQLLLEHPGFVMWVTSMLHDFTDAKFLFRGAVVGAMFTCYRKSQKDAATFWEAVRDGTGAKPTDPDRKLQKYLLSTALGRGRGTTTGKVVDDERAMYSKCVHAWNAWRKGTTTDLKYYASASVPSAV